MFWVARTAPAERCDMTDQRDAEESAESSESSENADPMENAEQKEPTDPTDRAEPTDPMDSTDPLEPIDRIDPSDHRDHFDVCASVSVTMLILLASASTTERGAAPDPVARGVERRPQPHGGRADRAADIHLVGTGADEAGRDGLPGRVAEVAEADRGTDRLAPPRRGHLADRH